MENKEFLKRIGIEIRVARIRKGLTQSDVSQKAGLAPHSFSAIELGKFDTRLTTYKRIAEALEIDLKDLITFVK